MRCTLRASNGPNHLGFCSQQGYQTAIFGKANFNTCEGFDRWFQVKRGLSRPFRGPFTAFLLPFRCPFAALSRPFHCPFTALSLSPAVGPRVRSSGTAGRGKTTRRRTAPSTSARRWGPQRIFKGCVGCLVGLFKDVLLPRPREVGLSSNKMALITSDCAKMRHPSIKCPNHLGLCAREGDRLRDGAPRQQDPRVAQPADRHRAGPQRPAAHL